MNNGFEIIDFLIKDELEAIDGYVDAVNKLKDCEFENKKEIMADLERIKDDEYRHIEILKNIGKNDKFDEIVCKRIGGN